MSFTIQAPLDGSLIGLRSVPDPVFADQLVGPGIAIVPAHADGPSDVCAPVSGTVKTLHSHAFIIELEAGPLVLVHIGIDTVSLQGRGFEAPRLKPERHSSDGTPESRRMRAVLSWSRSLFSPLKHSAAL